MIHIVTTHCMHEKSHEHNNNITHLKHAQTMYNTLHVHNHTHVHTRELRELLIKICSEA